MKPVNEVKKTSVKTPARRNTAKPRKLSTNAAPTRTVPVRAARPTRSMPTTIEAHIDVGFGNNLFVRGQGAGLSWERGVPLKNVDPQTWLFAAEADSELKFKLLLNDSIWAQGEDVVVTPGQKIELKPTF